jgi:Secretion system C-terminal sorting domain
MKRIITSSALALMLFITNTASSQLVSSVSCTTVGEDFETDPIARGFTIQNFTWVGHQTSGQSLRTWSALPNTQYVITTPLVPIYYYGSILMGFKVKTSPGSNDYFATGGFNTTIHVLDSVNNVLATSTGFFNKAGNYCFQAVSFDLRPGMNVRYKYTLTSTAQIDGTRIVDFDLLTYNGTNQVIIMLPVNFTNITGRATSSGNLVTWNVAEEINVDHYEIEKSSNGINFSRTGDVKAIGSSSYSFTDKASSSSDYYRVKAVDIDGKAKLSPVVAIKNGKDGRISLRAFPSPAITELTIQHDAITNANISITAADGRLLKNITPVKGNIQTTINVSSLQPGLYIIKFQDSEGNMESLKFIKQ